MSASDDSPGSPVSLPAERRVDAVCMRFEVALQGGSMPRAEDYLGDTPEPERAVLLRELRRLESEYRLRCGGAPTTPPEESEHREPSPGMPHLPGYEVLEELGRGGMGVVYRARQSRANRLVALKCILAGRLASPEEVERFQKEARAAASLDHPNIVPIHDVGEHEGQHYFTMKLVAGENLADQVLRGPLPSRRAAELIATIARAVHYAHGEGFLHRDLKPGNILIDEHGQPHLTDFGLAKRLDGPVHDTRPGLVLGTPGYMSPEQAAGRSHELTPAADVYGLGAVLYALLTGRPPFQAATLLETIDKVRGEPPTLPSSLNPKVHADLETICLKCLEKDPANRFASAAELADELDHYLRGEPIRIRRPTWVSSVTRYLIESDPLVDRKTWRTVSLWGAAIISSTHLLIYWLVLTGQPAPVFWGTYAANLLVNWAIMGYYLALPGPRLTHNERHILTLRLGHTLAIPVIWSAAGGPCDARLWSLYPAFAALYGVTYFAHGSIYWTRYYLVGAAWFLLALLMPLRPEWSPLEYGLFYVSSVVLMNRVFARSREG